MKSKILFIAFVCALSCSLSVKAQTAFTENTSTVRCRPDLVSSGVSLFSRDIKRMFSTLNTTEGNVKTSYSASPRLKISYSPSTANQKIKASTLFPNVAISATAPANAATVNITGISGITNICSPVTVTVKISGSVRKSVTTTTNGESKTERSTLPLSGSDIVIPNVVTSFS